MSCRSGQPEGGWGSRLRALSDAPKRQGLNGTIELRRTLRSADPGVRVFRAHVPVDDPQGLCSRLVPLVSDPDPDPDPDLDLDDHPVDRFCPDAVARLAGDGGR